VKVLELDRGQTAERGVASARVQRTSNHSKACGAQRAMAGEQVGGRPVPSAELLRQHDDDPLRAADVAEPIAVLVAHHLADELSYSAQ
jgi:hypothetical protein